MPVKNKPPKYVKLRNSALRFLKGSNVYNNHEPDQYWSDAGQWGVEFRFDDIEQKWYSVCEYDDLSQLDNVELIPITREEWKEDNRGYI